MIFHEIKKFVKKDEHLPVVVVVGSEKKIIKKRWEAFWR